MQLEVSLHSLATLLLQYITLLSGSLMAAGFQKLLNRTSLMCPLSLKSNIPLVR